MISGRSRIAASLTLAMCLGAGTAVAEDLEEAVGRHMVAQALLTAHLVAVAGRAGLGTEEIRAILERTWPTARRSTSSGSPTPRATPSSATAT